MVTETAQKQKYSKLKHKNQEFQSIIKKGSTFIGKIDLNDSNGEVFSLLWTEE